MAWNGLAALHCLKTFMKASFYHIEIIQLICRAKQVTSFYIRGRGPYNIFGSIVRKYKEYLYRTFSCFLELGLNKWSKLNLFVLYAPFPYPLKTSKNLKVLCFQRVEKGCIGNKCLKKILTHFILFPLYSTTLWYSAAIAPEYWEALEEIGALARNWLNIHSVKYAITEFPASVFLFAVNNWNTRTMCEIYSKLTVNIPERHRCRFCLFTGKSGYEKIRILAYFMKSFLAKDNIWK